MAIPKERIQLILGRFSLLFPLPVDPIYTDALVDVWVNLFCDFDAKAFEAAVRPLALRLKRFPLPADFVEEIAANVASSAPSVAKTE